MKIDKKCLTMALVLYSTITLAENQTFVIEVNTEEIQVPKQKVFSKEVSQLKKVLDTYFQSNDITIKVRFIDPAPYPDYVQWLFDWWSDSFEEEEASEDIEILFNKDEESNKWNYEGIKVANQDLKEKHLLTKVMQYAKQKVVTKESNEEQIIKNWLIALSRILDKSWLKALKIHSESFALRKEYDRKYAGFDMNYYEFFPLEKNNIR